MEKGAVGMRSEWNTIRPLQAINLVEGALGGGKS
jgi:hypothetical protein